MEIRHLRYFMAVAEEGHITRAAERLGMQQPPLSQQIKAIERELDVLLFRRKPRGVELTAAGQAFLDYARSIVTNLDRAFETTRPTARGEQGSIRIGVTPTSPFHPLVPRVIRTFREEYPLIALTLMGYNSGDLIDLLVNERADAAFFRQHPAPDFRNDDWEYAIFDPNGALRTKANYAACFKCHLPQAKQDFVFSMPQLLKRTQQ